MFYDGTKILAVDTLPKEDAPKALKIDSNGIGFSQDGINGNYTSSWGMDGVLKPKDDKALEDYIIAQGESNDWTYMKYANGAVELWSKQTLSSLTWASFINYQDANAQTVDLLYSTTKTIALPIDVANAKVTATISDTSDAWVSSVTISADELTIQIISNDELTSVDVSIHVQGEVVSDD